MGLDATIRAPNRQSLGESQEVERVLAAVFPGIRLKRATYLRRQNVWEAIGNYFPGALQRLLNRPGVAGHSGDFEGDGFSALFSFPVGDVRQIDVELYGRTVNARAKFDELTRLKGWEIGYG
jgi:hypothetical protein